MRVNDILLFTLFVFPRARDNVSRSNVVFFCQGQTPRGFLFILRLI